MITQTDKALKKSLNSPDETRPVGNGLIELVNLEGVKIARVTLKPGWSWSQDVKPAAKTESCRQEHVQYVLSGQLAVVMDDGTELELKAGDVAVIPPGHDARVVGDEPFTAIDFAGLEEYAKSRQEEAYGEDLDTLIEW